MRVVGRAVIARGRRRSPTTEGAPNKPKAAAEGQHQGQARSAVRHAAMIESRVAIQLAKSFH